MSSKDIEIFEPNRFYCRFFYHTTVFLMKRTFHSVCMNQLPETDPSRSVLVLLNHHSWWDGIFPLVLSERYYPQKGLALMEDKQIENHPFFKKIGAQPITRKNTSEALKTLAGLADYMSANPSVLFLYPQGAIFPNHEDYFSVQRGYQMLLDNIPDLQIHLITTYSHAMWNRKPELLLRLTPVDKNAVATKEDLSDSMKSELNLVRKEALNNPPTYLPLI